MAKQGKKAAPNSKTMGKMLAMQGALEMDLHPTGASGAVGGLDLETKLVQPMPTRSAGKRSIQLHFLPTTKHFLWDSTDA